MLIELREIHVDAPAARAFDAIRRIGGETGWYYADWLWHVRGWLDRLAGGTGFRPGRRHPDELVVGDSVDCMRVVEFEPDRRLVLGFEMKLPGRAWLEFTVAPNGRGSTIRQEALYDPQGLAGLAYWYIIYPIHHLVFTGMIRGIARTAGAARVENPGS